MRRGEEEEEEESGSKAEIIWLTESIPFSFSTMSDIQSGIGYNNRIEGKSDKRLLFPPMFMR